MTRLEETQQKHGQLPAVESDYSRWLQETDQVSFAPKQSTPQPPDFGSKYLPKVSFFDSQSGTLVADKSNTVGLGANENDKKPPGKHDATDADDRITNVVKSLNEKSNPEDFHHAAELLAKEGKQGVTWRQWAEAEEQLFTLSDALKKTEELFLARSNSMDSQRAANDAVAALIRQANGGNQYALTAITTVLLSQAGDRAIQQWESKYGHEDGKSFYIPPLTDGFQKSREVTTICDQLFELSGDVNGAQAAALAAGFAAYGSKYGASSYSQLTQEAILRKLTHALESYVPRPKDQVDDTVNGILTAFEWRLPGIEKLCPLLQGHMDLPSFARHYQQIEQLATQLDKGALAIVAAVAAGNADDNPDLIAKEGVPDSQHLSGKACKLLEELGSKDGAAPIVVKSILTAYDAGLRESGGTPHLRDRHELGAVLGKLSANLDPSQDADLLKEVHTSLARGLNEGSEAAVDGLLSLPQLLQPEDIAKLLSSRKFSDAHARALQDAFWLERSNTPSALQQKLEHEFRESLQPILNVNREALDKGSATDRLNAVNELAQFGKFASAEDARSLAGYQGAEGARRLQEAGLTIEEVRQFQTLAGQALLRMSCSKDATEAAIEALKKPWPGLENDDVRSALIGYARGDIREIWSNDEAKKIAYKFDMTPPLAESFALHGVKGTADELMDMAQAAIKHYSKDGIDGRQVVQQVLANVERLNALPGDLREELTGSPDQFDIKQVIGQLVNGTIDANSPPGNPLFKDNDTWLIEKQSKLQKDIDQLQQMYKKAVVDDQGTLRQLGKHTTEDAVSLWQEIKYAFGATGDIDEFTRLQKKYVGDLRDQEDKEKFLARLINAEQSELNGVRLAIDAGRVAELSHIDLRLADKDAMKTLATTPSDLLLQQQMAGEGLLTYGQGALKRAYSIGYANVSEIPMPASFSDGLGVLSHIQPNTELSDKDYHWYVDADLIRKVGLQAVDNDPTMQHLQKAAFEIGQVAPTLYSLFDSGSKGTRYEDFVKLAREKAQGLNDALSSFSAADIQSLKNELGELKQAYKNIGFRDVDTACALKDRANAIEQMLTLVDPKSAKNSQLKNLVDTILHSDKFDETTFQHWAVTDGPVVLAAMAAAAAVIVATGGTGTPAAVALAGLAAAPAAGMVAAESVKELEFQSGLRKEGSLAGEWARGRQVIDEQTGLLRQMDLLGDVGQPYLRQYATDLVIILATLGMGKALGNMTKEALAEFLAINGREISVTARVLAESEKAAAKAGVSATFAKEFAKQFLGLAGFGAAQAVGEDSLKNLFHGESSILVPVLVATMLIAVHGVVFEPIAGTNRVRIDMDPANPEYGKIVELLKRQQEMLRQQGNSVSDTESGGFKVRTWDGKEVIFEPSERLAAKLQSELPKPASPTEPVTIAPSVPSDATLQSSQHWEGSLGDTLAEGANSNVAAVIQGQPLQPGQEIIIGRGNLCDVEVPDPTARVSRRHLRLRVDQNGAIYITDLNTLNGTTVNDQPIGDREVKLNPGDKVRLAGRLLALDISLHPEIAKVQDTNLPEVTSKPDAEALRQSNEYAAQCQISEPLKDGWQNAGYLNTFDADGNFNASSRNSTVVDRAQDPVLRNVIADAKTKFGNLPPKERAAALTKYVNELLTPPGWRTNEYPLDAWYSKFCREHAGERILLGEFIKQGKGVCSQQALLLKVLADELGLNATLVRGNASGSGKSMDHAWTTFDFGDGSPRIYDPRWKATDLDPNSTPTHKPGFKIIQDQQLAQRKVAPPPLEDPRLWKAEDEVLFDGKQWKIKAIDLASGKVTLKNSGSKEVDSAVLARLNPGRKLTPSSANDPQSQQTWTLKRSNGLVEGGWHLVAVGADGSCYLFKDDAFQVTVDVSAVRRKR